MVYTLKHAVYIYIRRARMLVLRELLSAGGGGGKPAVAVAFLEAPPLPPPLPPPLLRQRHTLRGTTMTAVTSAAAEGNGVEGSSSEAATVVGGQARNGCFNWGFFLQFNSILPIHKSFIEWLFPTLAGCPPRTRRRPTTVFQTLPFALHLLYIQTCHAETRGKLIVKGRQTATRRGTQRRMEIH